MIFDQKIYTCVISNPSNSKYAQETIARCEEVGIKAVAVDGSTRYTGDEQNSPVERAHLRAISHYNRKKELRSYHLFVIEDDCEFVPGAKQIIENAILKLDKNPSSWASLHLGHIPVGPAFPVSGLGGTSMLIWSSIPFTGHAYIINRHYVSIISNLPAHKFKRPYSQEGFCQYSLFKKFAIQPVIATQNRRPKELVDIDNGKLAWPLCYLTPLFEFSDWNHFFCLIGFVLIPLLFIIFILAAKKIITCTKKYLTYIK